MNNPDSFESASDRLPPNYRGTAFGSPDIPPASYIDEKNEAATTLREGETVAASAGTPGRAPFLGGLLGGVGFDNADLLIMLVALIIYEESGESMLPLILIALLVLAK